MEPLVPMQYMKAKSDMVVLSHDAAYKVKAREMFKYQPFVMKDPRVFERTEEFMVEMFVGGKERRREGLLKYMIWSNRP